jgi:AraC family transcriptional regulator of adaptative response / methylphosphotriester-DNA alkyltransferase methyltransferase
MPAIIPKKLLARQHEITADFLKLIDVHLDDIMAERRADMWEIRDFADHLHIHPTHLSNTIKLATGKAPCYFFESRLMDISRKLLAETTMSIGEIAIKLTYDPSNYTKFFKHFEGITPKQYREKLQLQQYQTQNTETVTI